VGLRFLRIGPEDHRAHEAYFRYVPRVFPSIDFRAWRDRGGWTDDYQAHALVEVDEIVANVSVARMDLVVGGRPARGMQLGAVGVVPERRGEGLQRGLLEYVLGAIAEEADLVFLFANDEVLDFYPRFGFERVEERVFGAEASILPSPDRLPRLRLDRPDDLDLFRAACASALPVTERFGAARYGWIALWYATYFVGQHLFHAPEHDAVVVARQKGELLEVLDVIAPRRFDLAPVLARIVDSPVRRIEFGFTPELWWSAAGPLRPPADSTLFLRGRVSIPARPIHFPALART
jgi:predicted N-acetyltransferase YhbS